MWFANVLEFLNVDKSFVPEEVEVPSQPHVPYFIGLSHALPIREIKRAIGRCNSQTFQEVCKASDKQERVAETPRRRPSYPGRILSGRHTQAAGAHRQRSIGVATLAPGFM